MFVRDSMERKLKYKKGLSGVVTAMIMIGLVLVAAGIIWGVVSRILQSSEGAESCIETINKVTINGIYTCYDEGLEQVHFSLSIEDIDVDEVAVSISSAGNVQSYTLTNTDETIDDLFPYKTKASYCPATACTGNDVCINGNCIPPQAVKLPGKRGGQTYVANGFISEPDLIRIAPTISGKSCDVSDSLSHIEFCSLSA